MVFTASSDRLVKTITIAITFLFAFCLAQYVSLFAAGTRYNFIVPILLIIIPYILCYLYRSTGYQLTADQLIIHRPYKNKIIQRTQIRKAELLEKGALKWTVRVFGNGGLFGYSGKFTNTRIGVMTWYATRTNNMVLLRMHDGRKIVITPDNPKEFIDTLFAD